MYKIIWDVQINQFINPKSICTLKWSYFQIIRDFGGMYSHTLYFSIFTKYSRDLEFFLCEKSYLSCIICYMANFIIPADCYNAGPGAEIFCGDTGVNGCSNT